LAAAIDAGGDHTVRLEPDDARGCALAVDVRAEPR
jgi:hypothetical protein